MQKALTIAGSDSGGGAGIQADLKTFTAFGVYGMSVITALTAQNTLGVQGIFEVSTEFIEEQIRSIMADMGTDAVKTGMLANEAIVSTVAKSIKKYDMRNLVVDPVMIAKGGDSLLSDCARITIMNELIPLATIVTPNRFEAEVMLDMKITSIDSMKHAARKLKELGPQWVILKGGHIDESSDMAIDVVFNGEEYFLLEAERFNTKNTHGTGCTFSSAIAAGLAKKYEPIEAIQRAKVFITRAIKENFELGKGHGPTNHFVGTTTEW
ncbi:bifunctional hydroxymethylpyrimidine kinase/phosphomethylpyrimidine kinase [candidate division KSB1 bacterium]|nr:bifunctional hydroxymethylpyrimidine kinase/phosphomethylpyrimidine kinase [candidate division KSB1 bacterium]